ncbi:carboxypeptidase regulatory-like domain-containing protein [Jiangella asiatica]|nr:carboxypeptidase regulatory-like domain-containing protein [Jiangella asiatica]
MRHPRTTRARRALAMIAAAGVAGAALVTGSTAAAEEATAAVTGTVRDGSGQGWPLWAQVSVEGQPDATTLTDPATGEYQLDLPPGTHTVTVTSRYPGYEPVTTQVEAGATADVVLAIDPARCFAPGYQLESAGVAASFDDGLPDGWSVVDGIGDEQVWRFDDPGERGNLTGGRAGFAIVDSYFYSYPNRQDTSLVTPVMDLTDLAAPEIGFASDFDTFVYDSGAAGIADVDLSLDGGATWETVWHQVEPVRGPGAEVVPIPQAAGQDEVQVRFRYHEGPYTAANWWQLDDVYVGDRSCAPIDGGMVTGHVTDGNTGEPVAGASVGAADGTASTTSADDGFYWLFVPGTGSRELTASRLQYREAPITADVVTGTTATADVELGAGMLTTSVTSLDLDAELGEPATATVTVTNDGTEPTGVTLAERPGSFVPRTEDHTRGEQTAATPGTAAEVAATAWQALPDYPVDIVENVAGMHDGKIYSVGGRSGFDIGITRGWVYDPAVGSWATLPAMPTGRSAPVGEFIDGKFYVTGGREPGIYESGISEGTDVYDPAAGTWTTEPGAPIPVTGGGSFVLDGKLYVVGGCLSSEDEDCGTDDVFRYDPATRKWDQVADYPEPIAEPMCGAIEAKAYCAGGFLIRVPTMTSAYEYDPKMDTWTPVAPLPLDLAAAGHTVADGKLLVSGGVNGGRYHDSVTAGFAYDPVTDAWSELPATANNLARGGSTCGFTRVGGGFAGYAESPFVETLPGYTDCASDRDAAWLETAAPATTLAPGESMEVTLTVSGDEPGAYNGTLLVRGDDTPYDQREVDLVLDTVAPRTWGAVSGTVSGVACDGSTVPLSGTDVWIEARDETHDLRTGADGSYTLWLPVGQNPLRVFAGSDVWVPRTVSARVAPGRVTELDLTLRRISCP